MTQLLVVRVFHAPFWDFCFLFCYYRRGILVRSYEALPAPRSYDLPSQPMLEAAMTIEHPSCSPFRVQVPARRVEDSPLVNIGQGPAVRPPSLTPGGSRYEPTATGPRYSCVEKSPRSAPNGAFQRDNAVVGQGGIGLRLREGLELHISKIKNKGTAEATIAEYNLAARHLSDWLELPLRRLTRTMVRERHQRIGRDAGPYAANKTMRGLRAFWNTARREDETLGESPTIAVHWFREERRKSGIPLALLSVWFSEVAAMENAVKRDFLLLTILTGLRKATVCAIRREHFDKAAGTLHIPRPKGGQVRAFTIPLSDAAMVIVDRRLRATKCEWLFPSATSASGHIEDPRPEPLSERLSVPFTIHGLRATYIGAAHAAGVTDRHTQLLANHAVHSSDVHGGYILHDPDALRPSQQRISDFLRKHGLDV